MSICDEEKTFILHGVEENLRTDGRSCMEYRPMELELGVVQTSFGSARLRLANTDVLVSVKVETDTPNTSTPDIGKLEFYVACSANATPDFEGRGGDTLATQIASSLTAAYRSNSAFDASQLCILRGKRCWKLYVDVLVLECGGNLYDGVSLGVKAALWDTRLPHISNVTVDGGSKVDIEVSDDVAACTRLNINSAPIMVTVCRIGSSTGAASCLLVDPTDAEEQCCGGSVIVACCGSETEKHEQQGISTVLQTGGGSLQPATLLEALKTGREVAGRLQEALIKVFQRCERNGEDIGEPIGFL